MHRIGQDGIGSGSATLPINGRCPCDAWTPQTCNVVTKYAAYSLDAWMTKLSHKHSRPKRRESVQFDSLEFHKECLRIRISRLTRYMPICSLHFVAMPPRRLRFPCSVCDKGYGMDTVQCTTYTSWVHAACIGILPRDLDCFEGPDVDYTCSRCFERRQDGTFDFQIPLMR